MRNVSLRYGSALLALVGAGALVHCGGDSVTPIAEFPDTGTVPEVGNETGEETAVDTGAVEDTGSETGEETGDAVTAEDADSTTDAGCGTLSATATDVYVNKASTKPSVGTLECPFKTIVEATNLPAVSGRTIHVKGGGGSVATYTETGAVKVKGGVTLVGDGAASTKIVASDACGDGNCAVEVAAGATVDGFAISSSSNGVVMLDGGTDATVKNLLITDAQDGIVVLGPAALAGNVQANRNAKSGLHIKGAKTTKVTGTGNEFDENQSNGIEVEGTARLDFGGGSAKSNKGHGVHLKSTTPASASGRHSITGLTASSNGRSTGGSVIATSSGIMVENTSSLRLRSSKLLLNSHHGLAMTFSGNSLDIGSSGSNTFSVGTPTSGRNAHAGVCLEGTGASGSIDAGGNSWSTCGIAFGGPTQTEISGNCNAYTTQVDVAYKKAAGGGNNPLDFPALGGCSVGTP